MKNIDFDFFMDEMLDVAVAKFKATAQSELLHEKIEQMNRDCETMFTEDERDFAVECFELLLDVAGQEERFVYRQGLLDCITILKRLGVIL